MNSHHIQLLCSHQHLVLKGLQLGFQVLNFPAESMLVFFNLTISVSILQIASLSFESLYCLLFLPSSPVTDRKPSPVPIKLKDFTCSRRPPPVLPLAIPSPCLLIVELSPPSHCHSYQGRVENVLSNRTHNHHMYFRYKVLDI